MIMRLPPTFALILCSLCITATASADDNWPRFRGPTGDGQSKATGLPLKWSEQENVVWKKAIHDQGWSSPVIWGHQVWVTTGSEDGKELFAVCVDKDSGKILHDVKFEPEKPQVHKFNSPASPTPVIEEGRIYVHWGSPCTACLDTQTGKVIWQRQDLECNHFRAAGSSPILFGDLLYLTFDGFDHQYVAALNKADGTTAWKQDRSIKYHDSNGDLKKAFGTPSIIEVKGKAQLISSAADGTIAYEPQTGEEIWKVQYQGMNTATTPVYGQGLVFLTTGDSDTLLVAVKPDGRGDVTATHLEWKSKKGAPQRPSPVLIGDHLYVVSDGGVANCLEAKTGNVVKSVRLGGKFWASPILADGKLYCGNQEGSVFVVEANPEMKILAENQLDAGCMASPAVSGKALFVRTKTHLYRIEQK
jgi:outer membrane protein assembly factor BamB